MAERWISGMINRTQWPRFNLEKKFANLKALLVKDCLHVTANRDVLEILLCGPNIETLFNFSRISTFSRAVL